MHNIITSTDRGFDTGILGWIVITCIAFPLVYFISYSIVAVIVYFVLRLYKLFSLKKLFIFLLGFTLVHVLTTRLVGFPIFSPIPPIPLLLVDGDGVSNRIFFDSHLNLYQPLNNVFNLNWKGLIIQSPYYLTIYNIITNIAAGLYLYLVAKRYLRLKGRMLILFCLSMLVLTFSMAYNPMKDTSLLFK